MQEVKITYNIKEFRTKRNLSLRELSRLAGVSHTQIADVEKNKGTHLTVYTLVLIATALEVNPEDLYSYCKI